MLAEPRGRRKSLTTTSSSRKPTITVGASSSERRQRAVQARRPSAAPAGGSARRAPRRAPWRRGAGSDLRALALMPGPSRRGPPGASGRSHRCSTGRSSAVCAFGVPMRVSARRLASRSCVVLPHASHRLLPRQRRNRRHRAIVAQRRQRGERLEHQRMLLAERIAVLAECARASARRADVLQADERRDHGGARVAGRRPCSTVCSARTAAGSSMPASDDTAVGSTRTSLPRSSACSGATAAAVPMLAERLGQLALDEPARVVERGGDRRDRGRAELRRGAPSRDRWPTPPSSRWYADSRRGDGRRPDARESVSRRRRIRPRSDRRGASPLPSTPSTRRGCRSPRGRRQARSPACA